MVVLGDHFSKRKGLQTYIMPEANCFISYSWDSADHKKWVLHLAEELHKNGVFVYLDQWDVRPGSDIPHYMESSIRESNFVLLICTPNFAEKANSGSGGVGYEKSIVTGEIFQLALPTTKFIPVLRSGSPVTSIPSYLRSKAFVDFRDDGVFGAGVEQLVRHIHDIPAVMRPALGNRPTFGAPAVADSNVNRQASSATKPMRFDIGRFKQMVEYAYSTSGLSMDTRELATAWAEKRLEADPDFDIDRFKEMADFAYSTSGLNMDTRGLAAKWAEDRIRTDPNFDIGRYREMVDYAYSSSGLNMDTRQLARQWADKCLNIDPHFDIDRFKEMADYAYSTSGLNMATRELAAEWAFKKLTG